MILYSPSQNAFYSDSVHAEFPADAIEISDENYQALLSGQAAGQRIGCVDGKPQLLAPEPPSTEQLARHVRRHRDRLLSKVDSLLQRHRNQAEFGLSTTLTDEDARAVASYAQSLRDIPLQAGFPTTIQWPAGPAVHGLVKPSDAAT